MLYILPATSARVGTYGLWYEYKGRDAKMRVSKRLKTVMLKEERNKELKKGEDEFEGFDVKMWV